MVPYGKAGDARRCAIRRNERTVFGMDRSPHGTAVRRRILLTWSRACLIAGVVLFVASSWFLPQNSMDPRTHPLGVALAGGGIALVSVAGALLLRWDGILEGDWLRESNRD